jgi:zinc/manganese transport system permease protein
MLRLYIASFSINLISDFHDMWQYDFMRHAFEAGTIIAIVAGVVGYFVVLRKLSFAAHALSHAGFAGAAGAVLIGINPLLGLMAFTISGGLGMAALGKRAVNRDVQIGTVLAFMLGLGVLFISLYKGYATQAYSILFGEILGISATDVAISLIVGIIIILVMMTIFKPLFFSTIDEDVAEAKGVPVLGLGILFMIILAVAVSISVQLVGVLLIFALLVTPAAIAERLTQKPIHGVIVSIIVALGVTWFGIFSSYYLSYPVSFIITSSVFLLYLLVRIIKPRFNSL